MPDFGWSYPPGMNNLPWDESGDCEHVCEYCDGCHKVGCRGYEVPCVSAKKEQDVTLRVGAVVRILLPSASIYKGAFGVIEKQTTANVLFWHVRLLYPHYAVTLACSTMEIENVLADDLTLLSDEDLQARLEETDRRVQSLLVRSQCPPEHRETWNVLQRLYAEADTEKLSRRRLTLQDQDNNEYYGHGE